jgi:Mlc titration factor MtfA (ptsG expression regulator)
MVLGFIVFVVLLYIAIMVGHKYFQSGPPKPAWNGEVSADEILRYESYLDNFSYYKRLSETGRARFMNRLIEFMYDKRWEGWEGLEITEDKKVYISASAIQLTFGIEHYVFAHFHTIRIYPKAYYYKLTDQYFKGGTSESGVVSLSWKHFVQGYEDPDDKLNLGLHEWAHALKIDLASEDDFDSRFIHYFENWEAVSYPEFRKMHKGEPSFLRSYAGTNMHEFFAVCIEHFFEVPNEFNLYLPNIYRHLCLLLNQDPANNAGDYELTGEERHPRHARKAVYAEPAMAAAAMARPRPLLLDRIKIVKQGFRKWPMYIVAIGLFAGMSIIVVLSSYTVISTGLLILYVIAFGISGLLQWPYFRRRGMLEFRHFVMYSFCGFGLCAVALMMLLNYSIPISAPYRRIEPIERKDIIDGRYEVVVQTRPGESKLPVLKINDLYNGSAYVEIKMVRGIFGMEVIRDAEFAEK